MIQAFICCDYCNSLLYAASDGFIEKLQSVQNTAACLITGSRRCDHISHLLVQWHWLPVRRRVEYKVACLVHQSLSGEAPAYLTDDINLVDDSGRRLLRLRRTTHPRYKRRREFHCCWSARVEGTLCHSTCDETLASDYLNEQLITLLFGH